MNIKKEFDLTLKLNEDLFYLILKILKLQFIKESLYSSTKIEEPKIHKNKFYIKGMGLYINKKNYLNIDLCKELISFLNNLFNEFLKVNSTEEYKKFYPKLLNSFYIKIRNYYKNSIYIDDEYINSNIDYFSDNLKTFFYQKDILKNIINKIPKRFFSNDEKIENFINDFYLIKEKLKYNIENFIIDKNIISEIKNLYNTEYNSFIFPNYNLKTHFPDKSRSKQDLDKFFQDKPIYRFFQKIKKYTESFSNELFENKEKFENILIKLEALNFNNQELQMIFNKENLEKLLYNDHDFIYNKESLLNFIKSKKDLSTLLQIIHSNTLISDKFRRTKELYILAPLDQFQTIKYQEIVNEQSILHNQKEADIFNELINNKNLTNLNSDLFQKYFKILTILKSKDVKSFINKNLNKIQDLLPDFNKEEFLNILDKISNNDFKLSIKDKFIDKTLSTLNSIVAVNELHKYTKLAKPKIPQTNINVNIDDFQFKSLNYKDPLALTIGNDTDCCQKIGGAGAQAAIDSYINPTANVLVLYKDNKIISQSYFHVAKLNNQNLLILDNVESNNFNSKNVNLNSLYKNLANYLVNNNIFNKVLCGKEYNKLDNSSFKDHKLELDPRHFQVNNTYTDFDVNNHLILND